MWYRRGISGGEVEATTAGGGEDDMSQHYCLRWNNYQSNMTSVFHHLLRSQAFVDVTLACNHQSLKAHKVVLSACSSYFQKLLMENPCKHPTIIMPQDICFSDLKFIIEFVYRGEIDVSQAELQSLLKTADQLKIKGLCEVPEKECSPPPPAQVVTCLGSPTRHRHRHRPHKRRLHESLPLPHLLQPDYQLGGSCMDAATSTEGDVKMADETSRDGDLMETSHSMSPQPQLEEQDPLEQKFENSRSAEMTDRGVDAAPVDPVELPRADMSAHSNPEFNEDEEPVKVKYETLRTMDQSEEPDHLDASPASSDVKDDHNSMQTMMITPELLGLLPTSHAEGGVGGGGGEMMEGCPKQSKNWTAEDMEAALDALRSQTMSLTKASLHFGIPSTTLWQRAHRLGIDTPKKDGPAKSWTEDSLNIALDALRSGTISANKASKAYGIPSSTLYKIARREGIRLAAPFNAAPTTWNPEDLERALEAIRSGQTTVQRAAADYGIPSGTLYGRCKREGIGLTRNNPTPWSEQAMNDALEAVRIGQMSINQAAISFNLPYSSLYGRFKRGKFDTSNGAAGSDEEHHSDTHQPPHHVSASASASASAQQSQAQAQAASNGPTSQSQSIIQNALSSPPPPQPQIMLVQYQAPVQPPAIHVYTQPAT